MSIRRMTLAWIFSMSGVALFLAVMSVAPLDVSAQNYIPATQAFDSPGCSDSHLLREGEGIPSVARLNPEWKAIIIDPNQPPELQPPVLLEGFVSGPSANNQATAEVSEEDTPWTHYTHDFTFKVVPDPAYLALLSSWVRFPGVTISLPPLDPGSPLLCALFGGQFHPDGSCVVPPETCPDGSTGTTCHHTDMEVEWDNASLMDVKDPDGKVVEGFARDWGAVPEFVWPAVGDRVWIMGRWIFDCGHPNSDFRANVKYSTEIHPPRVLVTLRLKHPALDSFPRPRVSAPNFPPPQSYLPVTGVPVDPASLPPGVPNSGPTNVPVMEADIFVSVNGGGANDLCSIVPESCPGHTGPIIPVNDRNYVFDIYPPGTSFDATLSNGTFVVTPPVSDASLQWRVVNHFSELPAHACGGADNSVCVTVDPIICPIDAVTPPPTQSETGCPPVPTQPTRLRVILPFQGSNANFFAQSVLVGWDDVPTAANNTTGVRTFQVRLHKLTVDRDGKALGDRPDWRVFVNVGGQWRFISPFFDTDANNGSGISFFEGGNNVCHGAALNNFGDTDCFQFDNTPWTVGVQDGTSIHVGVGGYVAQGVEKSFCRNFPGGCDAPTFFGSETLGDIGLIQFERIGTYEFDLNAPDYRWLDAPSFKTALLGCAGIVIGSCGLQYEVEFSVQEVQPATPPTSAPLVIGLPNFVGAGRTYISASTPMIPQTGDPTAEGFQYRFHRQGDVLPTYATLPSQVPVHWAHVDLAPGVHSAEVRVGVANTGDGPYDFQYSAQSFGNLLEPRHTTTVVLDTTPPVITIVQPAATQYVHSATLILSDTVTDTGSGVKTVTPKMDGATTLPDGTGLASGQAIHLLTELSLGTHTFSINAADNVDNASVKSVTFSIIVTADSIKDDVRQFLQNGAIKNAGEASSLLAELDAAAAARAGGDCSTAGKIYRAFVQELQAQSGKGVDVSAAAIMIADAQYLSAHCP